MEQLLPRPTGTDFNTRNLANVRRKWKQTMQLHLTAVMSFKTKMGKYSVLLFIIGKKEEKYSMHGHEIKKKKMLQGKQLIRMTPQRHC